MPQTMIEIELGNRTGVNLQEIADRLGVNYYSSFEVRPCPHPEDPGNRYRILYLPLAEIYQEGRWRKIIIGGRPYQDESTAVSILQSAEKVQEAFLRAMNKLDQRERASLFISLDNHLANPLDNWKPELESD